MASDTDIEKSPPVLVYDFLISLPETIKDEVIAFFLMRAFDISIGSIGFENAQVEAGKQLLEITRVLKNSQVIRSISVIDYILYGIIHVGSTYKRDTNLLLQSSDLDDKIKSSINRMALSQPLRIRHAEAARQRWEELKADQLSFDRLRDLEIRFSRR